MRFPRLKFKLRFKIQNVKIIHVIVIDIKGSFYERTSLFALQKKNPWNEASKISSPDNMITQKAFTVA